MNTRPILRPLLAALFAALADSASAADSSDSARLINMATRAQIGGSAGNSGRPSPTRTSSPR